MKLLFSHFCMYHCTDCWHCSKKKHFLFPDSSLPWRLCSPHLSGSHDWHRSGFPHGLHRKADRPGGPRTHVSGQARLVHQPDGHQRKRSGLDSVRLRSSGNPRLPSALHGN